MIKIDTAMNGWIITDELNQVWIFDKWVEVADYLKTWAVDGIKKAS